MEGASCTVLFDAATSHRFPKILFRIPPAPSPPPFCVWGGIVLSTGERVCQQSPLLILQQSQLYTENLFAFL